VHKAEGLIFLLGKLIVSESMREEMLALLPSSGD